MVHHLGSYTKLYTSNHGIAKHCHVMKTLHTAGRSMPWKVILVHRMSTHSPPFIHPLYLPYLLTPLSTPFTSLTYSPPNPPPFPPQRKWGSKLAYSIGPPPTRNSAHYHAFHGAKHRVNNCLKKKGGLQGCMFLHSLNQPDRHTLSIWPPHTLGHAQDTHNVQGYASWLSVL